MEQGDGHFYGHRGCPSGGLVCLIAASGPRELNIGLLDRGRLG